MANEITPQVSDPFVEAARIKAPASAPTARLISDILSDVLNPKMFGATGNGTTDDTAALKKCFDSAFGGPNSVYNPGDEASHGITNAWKNRPVFLSRGRYLTDGTLTLTNIYGTKIFGSGVGASDIVFPPSAAVGLKIDGMKNCRFTDWDVIPDGSGAFTNLAVDLDGNAATGVGLGGNLFEHWGSGGTPVGTTSIAIRIGHSGTTDGDGVGDGNNFIRCSFGGALVAILVEHGIGNLFDGGGSGASTTFKCTGGAIHCHMHALDASSNIGHDISSNVPCTIFGCRTEADGGILVARGNSIVHVASCNVTGLPNPSFATLQDTASVTFESCYAATGNIIASAGTELIVRNCTLLGMGPVGAPAWTALGSVLKQHV